MKNHKTNWGQRSWNYWFHAQDLSERGGDLRLIPLYVDASINCYTCWIEKVCES